MFATKKVSLSRCAPFLQCVVYFYTKSVDISMDGGELYITVQMSAVLQETSKFSTSDHCISKKPNMSSDAWSWSCFWNSNSINPTTVIALSILLFLFTVSITLLRSKSHDEQPPGPRGLPLLGYLPFLGADLHREFARLSETYGPIYKLWLGKKLCVVITSPTIAKEVVREQDLVFANRDPTVASLTLTYGGYDIAFADYGEYWKKMRKIFVREMMSSNSIEGCSNLRRIEVQKSLRSLCNEKVGKPVVVVEFALELIISSIMAMVWGRTIKEEQGKSRRAEFQEAVAETMLVLGKMNVSDFFPFIARFDIQVREGFLLFLTSLFKSKSNLGRFVNYKL